MGHNCGLFGVAGDPDAAHRTYLGLTALQHRGQEGSGITSSDGQSIFSHRGSGFVDKVFSGKKFKDLPGNIAIGHNRYGTSGKGDHPQPVMGDFTMAHNGTIPDTTKLEEFLDSKNISTRGLNDSEMIHSATSYYTKRGSSLEEAIIDAQPLFADGAYSLLFMNKDQIIAVRDQHGIRPLSIGQSDGSWIFSSETCALDTIRASHIDNVKAGEMVIAETGQTELRRIQLFDGHETMSADEYYYIDKPNSKLGGQSIQIVRKRMGVILAREEGGIDADLVIGVPDSGIPAALGYAQESGILYDVGIISDRYVGRTFITPGQDERKKAVARKLHPIPEIVDGKRLIVGDDSIVRGTTAMKYVQDLRDAGAMEVHLRIPTPPIIYPNFYGLDTPKQENLFAYGKSLEEMRRILGVDSLRFVSLDGMVEAIGVPAENLDLSCFNGDYPVPIGKRRAEVVFDMHNR